MLKRVNKERVCCLVFFSEAIMAVFKLKISQIGTEFDKKNPKFAKLKVLCNFCQIFEKFRELECSNTQHDRNLLSSSLFRRDNCCFLSEKNLKLTLKKRKNKISHFLCFYAVFVKLSIDFVD